MKNKEMASQILYEFFYAFTGAVVVFSFLEIIWPGVVLAYINLNSVLIIWLINGIVIMLTDHYKDK